MERVIPGKSPAKVTVTCVAEKRKQSRVEGKFSTAVRVPGTGPVGDRDTRSTTQLRFSSLLQLQLGPPQINNAIG